MAYGYPIYFIIYAIQCSEKDFVNFQNGIRPFGSHFEDFQNHSLRVGSHFVTLQNHFLRVGSHFVNFQSHSDPWEVNLKVYKIFFVDWNAQIKGNKKARTWRALLSGKEKLLFLGCLLGLFGFFLGYLLPMLGLRFLFAWL